MNDVKLIILDESSNCSHGQKSIDLLLFTQWHIEHFGCTLKYRSRSIKNPSTYLIAQNHLISSTERWQMI